jgi:hypothetical protein
MTDDAAGTMTPASLRLRLEEARAVLVAALTGLGERDFAADAGGVSVTQLLAELASVEHEAIREARTAAGLEARPALGAGSATSRPLPPQVTHALAGTQYEARTLLDAIALRLAQGERTLDPPEVARLLLDGVAAREIEAAAQIAARTIEG